MADIKQMLPEQQKAIDSIKNTVVAAGAGSGKRQFFLSDI